MILHLLLTLLFYPTDQLVRFSEHLLTDLQNVLFELVSCSVFGKRAGGVGWPLYGSLSLLKFPIHEVVSIISG